MTLSHLTRSGWAAASTALLVACGGGASDGQGAAAVSTLTASPTRFSQTMTIAIVGRNLDQGIDLLVDGPCDNVTRVAGGTGDAVQFTCVVRGVGEIVPRVKASPGSRELASVRVTIPLPRVSVTLSNGTQTGSFVLELDPVAAPDTVANFMAYANGGTNAFYRNTAVAYADPTMGILLGGYTAAATGALTLKAPTRDPVKLEANNGLKNERGTVAMYRRGDANSATTEWFVNTQNNPRLDAGSAENPLGFTVFGRVIEGLEVVEVAAAVPTTTDLGSGNTLVPLTPVRITAISQTR